MLWVQASGFGVPSIGGVPTNPKGHVLRFIQFSMCYFLGSLYTATSEPRFKKMAQVASPELGHWIACGVLDFGIFRGPCKDNPNGMWAL